MSASIPDDQPLPAGSFAPVSEQQYGARTPGRLHAAGIVLGSLGLISAFSALVSAEPLIFLASIGAATGGFLFWAEGHRMAKSSDIRDRAISWNAVALKHLGTVLLLLAPGVLVAGLFRGDRVLVAAGAGAILLGLLVRGAGLGLAAVERLSCVGCHIAACQKSDPRKETDS